MRKKDGTLPFFNSYAVKFILEDRGYRVDFASNGIVGVEKALKEKPSLILMDMMMPGMDGYEATKKIRSNKKMQNVPIIAMTAQSAQEDRGRAKGAGCNDYLVKPFTLEDVSSKIKKWLA